MGRGDGGGGVDNEGCVYEEMGLLGVPGRRIMRTQGFLEGFLAENTCCLPILANANRYTNEHEHFVINQQVN